MNDQTDPEFNQVGNSKLDDDGIPILTEVVEQQKPQAEPSMDQATMEDTEQSAAIATPLPKSEEVLEELRSSLRSALGNELHLLVGRSVSTAVEQASQQLIKVVQDELTASVQNHLNELIEQALDRKFGSITRSSGEAKSNSDSAI